MDNKGCIPDQDPEVSSTNADENRLDKALGQGHPILVRILRDPRPSTDRSADVDNRAREEQGEHQEENHQNLDSRRDLTNKAKNFDTDGPPPPQPS